MTLAVRNINTEFSVLEAEMSQFLRLLTHDDRNSNYVLCSFEDGKLKHQWASKKEDLLQNVLVGMTDTFITRNGFNGYKRTSNRTRQINALLFDLDIHDGGLSSQELLVRKTHLLNVLEIAVTNKEIPQPTMIVDTGRGFHLYYCLARSSSYRKKGGAICENTLQWISDIEGRIDRRLNKIVESVPGASNDTSVHDLARVSRVPGTWNSKSNTFASLVAVHEEAMYTLQSLTLAVPKEQISDKASAKPMGKKREALIAKFSPVPMTRMREIELIRNYRDFNGKSGACTDNCRNELMFQYMNAAMQVYGLETAYELTQEFNKGFLDPLEDKELQATRDGLARNGSYSFRKSTFVEKLGVTLEEINTLKLFGSSREALRKAESERKAVKKRERNNRIIALVNVGKTYQEVASELGISRRTVCSVVKQLKGSRTYKKAHERVFVELGTRADALRELIANIAKAAVENSATDLQKVQFFGTDHSFVNKSFLNSLMLGTTSCVLPWSVKSFSSLPLIKNLKINPYPLELRHGT